LASVKHCTQLCVESSQKRWPKLPQLSSPTHSTQWPAPVSQYGVGGAHSAVDEHAGPLFDPPDLSPLPHAEIAMLTPKSEDVTR
jgi:hypothetical protein